MEQEYYQALNLLGRALDKLEEFQWQYHDYDTFYHIDAGYYCPDCGNNRKDWHTDNCELSKILEELRDESLPSTQR